MQSWLLKLLFRIIIVVIYCIPAGRSLATEQKSKKLKIELGRSFQKDQVKVYLDKKLVYNRKISTPDSALITDAFEITKPKKPFMITVEVNGEKFEKSSPKQKKELDKEDYLLLINYNRETEEVEIKTKIVIVLYD